MRYLTLLCAVAMMLGCESQQDPPAPQAPEAPVDDERGGGEAPVVDEPPPAPGPSAPPGADPYEWTRVQWLATEVDRLFSLRDQPGDFTTWRAATSPRAVNTLVITMQPKPTTAATLGEITDPAEREQRFLSMRDSDADQMFSELRIITDRHDHSDWAVAEVRSEPPSVLPGVPVHVARVRISDWPTLHPPDGFAGFRWSADSTDVPLTEP